MRVKIWTAAAVAAVTVAALGASTGQSASAASAGKDPGSTERGAAGTWTKISTGTSGITYHADLLRTADGVLHVVYPKTVGGAAQLGHTAIDADGTVALQNDVLPASWSQVEPSPRVIGDGAGGMRVVFGGIQTLEAGYWSDGRMYTLTAPESGASWTLPAEAVGASHAAYGSYGTAATALADGTPVAAFPLNSDITWHTGTAETADETFAVDSCCTYDMSMVRDGAEVWIGWYANGSTAATNGTFVRRIAPTLGPIVKAPQSSVGASSLPTGRVALVARTGGGVYAAYCVGYPYCNAIGLWKVGTTTVRKVPASKYAASIALSPGPSGRIWIAWADNIPQVRAVRTNMVGTAFGPRRTVGRPTGTDSVYNVAIDGTNGRGDVVIQVGNGFWHTQVAPGLGVKANPSTWKHGKKTTVSFTVADAGDPVPGAKVKVGSKTCTTAAAGRCSITFPKYTPAGRLVVKATMSGYGAGSTRLTVR